MTVHETIYRSSNGDDWLLERDTSGTVIAVGPGSRSKNGDLLPTQVKAGDKVLLPEYGGQKVQVDDKELFLFKDSELLGKWVD